MGRELEQEEDKVFEDFKRDFAMPLGKMIGGKTLHEGKNIAQGTAKHVAVGAVALGKHIPKAISEGAGAIECLKILWSGKNALQKYENRLQSGGKMLPDGTVIGRDDKVFRGNTVSLEALEHFDKNPQNVQIDDIYADELRKQFNESGLAYNARNVKEIEYVDDMIPKEEQDIDPETGEPIFDYEMEKEFDEFGEPIYETYTNKWGDEITKQKEHIKQQPAFNPITGEPVMNDVLDEKGNTIMVPLQRQKTEFVTEPQLNNKGEIIIDDDGNAVTQTVERPIWRDKTDKYGEVILNEATGEPEQEPVWEDVRDENGNIIMVPKQEQAMEDVKIPRMHKVLDENGQPILVPRQEQNIDPETGELLYDPQMEQYEVIVTEKKEFEYNPEDLQNAKNNLESVNNKEGHTAKEIEEAQSKLDKEIDRASKAYSKEGENKKFIKEERPKLDENGQIMKVIKERPKLDEKGNMMPDFSKPQMHNVKIPSHYRMSTVFTYKSVDAEKVQDLLSRATAAVEKKNATRESKGKNPLQSKVHGKKRYSLRNQLHKNLDKVKLQVPSHDRIHSKVQPSGR